MTATEVFRKFLPKKVKKEFYSVEPISTCHRYVVIYDDGKVWQRISPVKLEEDAKKGMQPEKYLWAALLDLRDFDREVEEAEARTSWVDVINAKLTSE
jgi:hypothetical protein